MLVGTGGLAILLAMEVPVREDPTAADLVIDAVVGYSLRGAPHGRATDLIRWAMTQPSPVLSLDVPSGLDATGWAASTSAPSWPGRSNRSSAQHASQQTGQSSGLARFVAVGQQRRGVHRDGIEDIPHRRVDQGEVADPDGGDRFVTAGHAAHERRSLLVLPDVVASHG